MRSEAHALIKEVQEEEIRFCSASLTQRFAGTIIVKGLPYFDRKCVVHASQTIANLMPLPLTSWPGWRLKKLLTSISENSAWPLSLSCPSQPTNGLHLGVQCPPSFPRESSVERDARDGHHCSIHWGRRAVAVYVLFLTQPGALRGAVCHAGGGCG